MNTAKNRAKNPESTKPRAADYLKIVEWSEEDGCFVGSAPPIIGPACHGDNEVEVYKELCEIVEEWLEIMERDGIPAPTATLQKEYSGKFILRTKPELHRTLAIRAAQIDESLNDYCVRKLRESLRLSVLTTGIVPAVLRDADFERIADVRYQFEAGQQIPHMQVLPFGDRLSEEDLRRATWLDFFQNLLCVPVSVHSERNDRAGIYDVTTPDKVPKSLSATKSRR